MKTKEIKQHGVYILKSKLNTLNGLITVFLFVRVFAINYDCIEVWLVGQPYTTLYTVKSEDLSLAENVL